MIAFERVHGDAVGRVEVPAIEIPGLAAKACHSPAHRGVSPAADTVVRHSMEINIADAVDRPDTIYIHATRKAHSDTGGCSCGRNSPFNGEVFEVIPFEVTLFGPAY